MGGHLVPPRQLSTPFVTLSTPLTLRLRSATLPGFLCTHSSRATVWAAPPSVSHRLFPLVFLPTSCPLHAVPGLTSPLARGNTRQLQRMALERPAPTPWETRLAAQQPTSLAPCSRTLPQWNL